MRVHMPYRDLVADELPQLNARLAELERIGVFFLGKRWDAASFVVRVSDDPQNGESDQVNLTPRQLFETKRLETEILKRVLKRSFVGNPAADGSPSSELLANYFLDLAGVEAVPLEDDEIPSDWKISMYSSAVREARRALPVGEQRNVFETWQSMLMDKNVRPWAMPALIHQPMHEALAAFGYRQDLKSFQIPFAVIWPDRQVTLKPSEQKKIQSLMSAVIFPEKIWFPFSETAFSRVSLEPVQVGRMVLFQCGLPKLDELKLMNLEFEHLLLIQSCDEPNMAMVISALRSPKGFAQDYPKNDFVQIHWPSLTLAVQKTGQTDVSLPALLRPESLNGFRKLGFLTKIEIDSETGIQSWKGALEPLPMFRLKSLGL